MNSPLPYIGGKSKLAETIINLSINDLPEMRETFGAFKMKPVSLKYSAPKEAWTQGRELLISNF